MEHRVTSLALLTLMTPLTFIGEYCDTVKLKVQVKVQEKVQVKVQVKVKVRDLGPIDCGPCEDHVKVTRDQCISAHTMVAFYCALLKPFL